MSANGKGRRAAPGKRKYQLMLKMAEGSGKDKRIMKLTEWDSLVRGTMAKVSDDTGLGVFRLQHGDTGVASCLARAIQEDWIHGRFTQCRRVMDLTGKAALTTRMYKHVQEAEGIRRRLVYPEVAPPSYKAARKYQVAKARRAQKAAQHQESTDQS